MNQSQMFYQSHCAIAASNHAKMAELQRKVGREDLANESEKTSLARRISAKEWQSSESVAENLAHGEDLVKATKFI